MKILVPLDGSTFAEAALGPAAKLAGETKAEVHLVSVISGEKAHKSGRLRGDSSEGYASSHFDALGISPHSGLPESRRQPMVESQGQALEREVHETGDYLSKMAGSFHPLEVKSQVVVGEHVAEELQSYAHREAIDLIAMASHGRTGLAHILLGSVAMELLKKGETPLMLIRPDDLRK